MKVRAPLARNARDLQCLQWPATAGRAAERTIFMALSDTTRCHHAPPVLSARPYHAGGLRRPTRSGAQMAELVDAPSSGGGARMGVEVRALFCTIYPFDNVRRIFCNPQKSIKKLVNSFGRVRPQPQGDWGPFRGRAPPFSGRPFHRLCAMPSRWHGYAMLSSPHRHSGTILILSSAEKCRRVRRRMSLTTCSAGFLDLEDLGFIFVPSSLRRSPNLP